MAIIHKLHEAIRELHTNAASINGDDLDTCTVWDDDGNEVTINADNVTAKAKELSDAHPMVMLRMARDKLLKDVVDPVISNPLLWASLSSDKQGEWTTYRSALLDLPANQTADDDSLSNINFPTQPS
tara:strand:- start:125 stop:505 length:381 start_codon:yes stop_codon:yes gene_type:complete